VERIAGFRLEASLKDLGKIRQFITQAAASREVDTSAIYDLNLAITELITNTLTYGYRRQPGLFEIELFQDNSDLSIQIRDEAPTFDPTRVQPPDLTLSLDERPLGKMGIYLAQRSLDGFSHRGIPEGGNEIFLVKKDVFASHHQEEPSHEIKD
jgi:serine/threonine-protein kinase RsbW